MSKAIERLKRLDKIRKSPDVEGKISTYSSIVSHLTRLTRKDTPFNWSSDAHSSFMLLKHAFSSAPILVHFNPTFPTILETDSSDYAISGILSQPQPDGSLRPVTFHSRMMQPAERNYDIYDKELLAVVDCFRSWRSYLEGATQTTVIISDHRTLEYCTSPPPSSCPSVRLTGLSFSQGSTTSSVIAL